MEDEYTVKRLNVLGSTGSIGQQTLDVVRAFPDEFRVVGLSTDTNVELLEQQIQEFRPQVVSLREPSSKTPKLPPDCQVIPLDMLAAHPETDLVVMAIVGHAGLSPTMQAIRAGKAIALANKEIMVMAGALIQEASNWWGSSILPLDSEPSAIWQCLRGEEQEISRLIITASGGAFRGKAKEDLETVTPDQALRHPTWNMGKKITIDSATLVNKAFEVIEAHWLFEVDWDRIEVVIHPQSIIHSMVEFMDGSVKAQLSPPDMRLPIQYALFYPDRKRNESLVRYDPVANSPLTFEPMEPGKYPSFEFVLSVGQRGGTWPTVVAAADEVAVDLFLQGQLRFLEIQQVLKSVVDQHEPIMTPSLEQIIATDAWAREMTMNIVR